jgi:cytoskeleton protein RodZ
VEVRAVAGVVLEIEIRDDPAWLAVWVDGVRVRQYGGVKQAGTRMTITAQRSVEVRTGNSGATHFTLNGNALGTLGRAGQPETWLFEPPAPPQRTSRTR